jgi:hypothetical protein
MKVKFLSGKENVSAKNFSRGIKAQKATETPTQIKRRAGAYKVTNNLAYGNNRGIEVPVNYSQNAPSRVSPVTATGPIVSTTITTTGRPIHVICTGDINPMDPSGIVGGWCDLQLYRDGDALGNLVRVQISNNEENKPYCLQIIDEPIADTHTYNLQLVNLLRPQGGPTPGYFDFGQFTGPVISVVELRD